MTPERRRKHFCNMMSSLRQLGQGLKEDWIGPTAGGGSPGERWLWVLDHDLPIPRTICLSVGALFFGARNGGKSKKPKMAHGSRCEFSTHQPMSKAIWLRAFYLEAVYYLKKGYRSSLCCIFSRIWGIAIAQFVWHLKVVFIWHLSYLSVKGTENKGLLLLLSKQGNWSLEFVT